MELTSLFSLIASITHRGMILKAEYYREKGNSVRKAGNLVADTLLICMPVDLFSEWLTELRVYLKPGVHGNS